ncbi:hypothetical protein [Halogeometricum sp. CBA1124]|uniref:hypothetical protein n=1 Tax=Halogeometricum sp. CBA1124 TaxID=2668071 RepID=UPI00142CCE79|nr:hypothetical protein [Halogeometricum sp. CBA1124]MUV56907.1 hypothetical protein [Halogeometricum sp. CBA1124]
MTDETERTTEATNRTTDGPNRASGDPADERTTGDRSESDRPAGDGPAGGDPDGSGASERSGGSETVDRLRTVLNYAVLAGLLLLAVLSAVQLYWAISRTISTFVVYEYRAPVQAAFNLVVLLVAALGISVQLRRLTGSDAAE